MTHDPDKFPQTKTFQLADINGSLTVIDMTVNLISGIPPLLLWDFTNIYWIIGFVSGWNLFAMMVSLFCIKKLGEITPDLNKSAVESEGNKKSSTEKNPEDLNKVMIKNDKPTVLKSLNLFYNSHLFTSSISLSSLYFTILGDSGPTRVYYLVNCLSRTVIAILIGLSAICGIIGGRYYKYLAKKYPENIFKVAGFASLTHFPVYFLCVFAILPGTSGSIFDPSGKLEFLEKIEISNSNNSSHFYQDVTVENFCYDQKTGIRKFYYTFSIIIFASGIVLGRIGLWSFDIAIMQLFQENIAESNRIAIGSIQGGLKSNFWPKIEFFDRKPNF